MYLLYYHKKISVELDAREICPLAEKQEKTQKMCKCQAYESCEWSKKTVENLSVLLGENILQGQNSGLFQAGHKFVHSRTCNFATQHVYCCNERHYPSINQMKILRGLEGSEINTRLGIDDTTDIPSTPKPVIKCNEGTLEVNCGPSFLSKETNDLILTLTNLVLFLTQFFQCDIRFFKSDASCFLIRI